MHLGVGHPQDSDRAMPDHTKGSDNHNSFWHNSGIKMVEKDIFWDGILRVTIHRRVKILRNILCQNYLGQTGALWIHIDRCKSAHVCTLYCSVEHLLFLFFPRTS